MKSYKFETFPKSKDSIFYGPKLFGTAFIHFKPIPRNDSNSHKYWVECRYGCKNYYCQNAYSNGNKIGISINREDWRFCYSDCPEQTNFERLYLSAIDNLGFFKIKHNVLLLKDKISDREMIFIRDENSKQKNEIKRN
jgi:hypothetical protein